MTDQNIIPSLWYAGNAQEAVDFYVSAFSDGKIIETATYPEEGLADFQKDLAGKVLTIDFSLHDFRFIAVNAGPDFTPNPSISLMFNFDPATDPQAREHLDELWQKLAEGGKALMPLGEYPFSPHYGWIQDRFGISWQLMLTNPDGQPRPFIIPSLMFTQEQTNHAEEAIRFYVSVFKDGLPGTMNPYPEDSGPAKAGSLMFGDFSLAGQWFAAMDGGGADHAFKFNEGISLMIMCDTQEEIDYYWDKLSAVPEAEQCGWLKDRFGVSWQVTPRNMGELMQRPQAFEHMMEMKKLVIADF